MRRPGALACPQISGLVVSMASLAIAIAGSCLAQDEYAAWRIDPTSFLVQARCADGWLKVASPSCAARPQAQSDPLVMHRHDWPAPDGYVELDSVMGPDGPETLWDFSQFGAFDPQRGDGGEVYVIDHASVRIAMTQDGGKPYLQGFYGAGCGGDGWVLFKADAPTGAWATLVARLSDSPVPSSCRHHSRALTRYRLENVTAPWIVNGRKINLTLPTIISEHFNQSSIATSRSMERSFFAKDAGRIIWESWSTNPPRGDHLAERCPGTHWSQPPGPAWQLSDCRYATNLITKVDGEDHFSMTWPPKITSLP